MQGRNREVKSPWSLVSHMYRRIWWMAVKWGLWEFPKDWLRTWTVWEMPGRVIRRYILLPTSLWYRVGLGKGPPSSLRNFLSSGEMSIIFSKSSNKVELFCILSLMITITSLWTRNLKSKKVRQIFVFLWQGYISPWYLSLDRTNPAGIHQISQVFHLKGEHKMPFEFFDDDSIIPLIDHIMDTYENECIHEISGR